MFFFPWQSFRRNSDDPLITWQERRDYVAIATDLPRMKKLQPQYLRQYDVAISTARRRKVPRQAVDIATVPVFFPRQAVDIATVPVFFSTNCRRYSDAACILFPRQAVDIATVLVVFKKKIMVISVRLSAISV